MNKTLTKYKQMTFTDELDRRKKKRQERCKHSFISIPIAFDEKQDEIYETVACIKCGYNQDD
jgi:hypothetical protein